MFLQAISQNSSYSSTSAFKPAESRPKHPFVAGYKTIISPIYTRIRVSWTVFIWCLLGIIRWKNSVILLIPILILHFSRTHSVSRSPSKLHWNLFERFFLDVHLAFTWASATRKICELLKDAAIPVHVGIGEVRF